MKKTIVTALLVLLSNFIIFGQDSCVVKVCLGDCINCYGNFYSVEKLDNTVAKTLVFPKISEKEAVFYSKNLLHIDNLKKYNIVLSDSIYNALQTTNTSEVIYYKNNKKIIHQNLEKFNAVHNSSMINESRNIKLPDSIIFSNFVHLITTEKYFMISDNLGGKIVLVNKHNPDSLKIFRSEDLTNQTVFNEVTRNDTIFKVFTKYKSYLRYANYDRVRISPCIGSRNYLSSFLEVPYPKIGNNTIRVTIAYGIIEFLNENKFALFGYNKKKVPEEYYLNASALYHSYKNEYILPVTKYDSITDKKNYCLAKFIKKNNTLNFKSFLPFLLPQEYEQLKGVMVIPTFIYPYVFYQFSLSVFNLETNKIEKLPLPPQKLNFEFDNENKKVLHKEFTYMFGDAYIEGSSLYVLYRDMTNRYLLTVNKNDFSKKELKKLDFDSSKTKSPIYLLNSKYLYYFTDNNEIRIEKIKFSD